MANMNFAFQLMASELFILLCDEKWSQVYEQTGFIMLYKYQLLSYEV